MQRTVTVLEILVPIFAALFLGVLARRKKMLTGEGVAGLQQYVLKFGLPCVLFGSCLDAKIGAESIASIVCVDVMLLIGMLWSFAARRKRYPYHSLPLAFTAQESGMLGIPLFMTLFGSAQAYRMGVLDMAQQLVAIPVLTLLSVTGSQKASLGHIVKKVVTSPLLLMSLGGLALNLTGIKAWLDAMHVGSIITETTEFIAQPVSAAILFSVGYNFSLGEGSRSVIMRLFTIHTVYFAAFGALIQLALMLVPGVEPLTRWAMLIYTTLPASFLCPGLGKNDEERQVTAGMCSLGTVVSLAVFCVIAVFVS